MPSDELLARVDRQLDRIERSPRTHIALLLLILVLLLVGWPLGLHPACQVLTFC